MRNILLILSLASIVSGDVIVDVTLGTSALTADTIAGPYSIDFQVIDGSGTGNGDNTFSVSNFGFGGGSASGSPMTTGAVSGDLTSSVVITNSQFFNEFTEGFTPGRFLTFMLDFSTKVDSPTPDTFSFDIEDGTGTPLPTMGIYTIGSDALLFVQLDSSNPSLQTFASDTSRSPIAGGAPIDIPTPQVIAAGPITTTPEASTSLLAILGLALLTICSIRGIRRNLR